MKKTFIILTVVALLLLGAVPVVQSIKLHHRQEQLSAALAGLETVTGELETLKAECVSLERQRSSLRQELQDLRSRTTAADSVAINPGSDSTSMAAAERSTSSSQPPGSGLRSMVAKMLEDPEMRKFMRGTQRQMLDPLYQPLMKKLGLTTDEANAFKDFLADNQMKAAEKAATLMGGTSAERAEAMKVLSDEQKQNEQYIRDFLGEQRYAQYQDYQQTLGERAQLSQFRMQTAGSEQALTDDQTEWLLTLMKEEKQAVASTAGHTLSGADQDPAALQAMLSGEAAEQLLKAQEALNQRVYARAAEGLSAEQLAAFGQFQANQLQMTRVGMSMAKQMFAPEAAEGR